MWNIEYNAVYWPEKSAYYVIVSLFLPFLVAFTGRLDWLETRAHLLLFAITIRLFPWGGNGSLIATIGLGEGIFQNLALQWFFAISGVVFSIVCVVEAYLMVKYDRPYFNYGLPDDQFAISKDHAAKEAVNAAMNYAHDHMKVKAAAAYQEE